VVGVEVEGGIIPRSFSSAESLAPLQALKKITKNKYQNEIHLI
jgi:hypothetical protein